MKPNYIENFDILLATITHLGVTDKASRTPTFIAKDLGFEKEAVVKVLKEFPGFFRKSRNTSKLDKSRGEYFYTLHWRYSRRKIDNREEGESQPLDTDEINILINILARMHEQEQENMRKEDEIYQNFKNVNSKNRITMIAAIIAAVGAVLAAIGI